MKPGGAFKAGVELAPPPSVTFTGVHYANTVSLHTAITLAEETVSKVMYAQPRG